MFPGAGAYGGSQIGDIVANLRIDQAWGGAQIMGALHDVNPIGYSTSPGGGPSPGNAGSAGGHPSDAWGWAVGAGLRLNFPMIGAGDFFQAQVNATQGALRYIMFSPNQNWGKQDNGKLAYGVTSDCVYGGTLAAGNTTSCQLTSAWGFNAAYKHNWSPAWQTSAYGGWDKVSYDSQANAMLCSGASTAANLSGTGSGSGAVAAAGCNNNWSTWFVGSRTQWNVSKTFYMGLDVTFMQMNGASTGTGSPGGYAGTPALGNATGVETHSSDIAIRFRAHKDFLP